jgi:hypothetical protein
MTSQQLDLIWWICTPLGVVLLAIPWFLHFVYGR